MKELLKGYINGYLVVKCEGEYALETEGDPCFAEQDDWDDMFPGMSPEEVDSQLEPTTINEILSTNGYGFEDWLAAKQDLYFVITRSGMDIFTDYYDTAEEAINAAQSKWESYTEYEKKRISVEAGVGKSDEYNPLWVGGSVNDLQELTGQEAGIVLFEDGNVIVCNWAQQCPNGGLPIMDPAGLFVLGWPGEIELLEEEDLIDDIREALPELEDMSVLAGHFGDIPALFGVDVGLGSTVLLDKDGNLEPTRGKIYKVSSSGTRATVIAPEGWN